MSYFAAAASVVDRPLAVEASSGSFWRKDQPVVDEKRNILKGGMWDGQRQWWELPNFIKVLVGGYGSGKTNIASKRAIALALENAPCPVAVVSPTFMVARNTVISTIANLLEGRRQVFGSRSFKWLYNATYHEFRIMFRGRTGVIIVYSGENPLSLRGPNLAAAVIDEPFIQDVEVFNQMIARVRHPHARRMEIGLTGTPEQLNWGYDLCIGELSERHDVAYVQVSTRQNQALAPSYVERLLGSLPGKAAQAYIDGGFVNLATGLVYYAFDPFENVVDLHMTDGVQLGCGMDFNVNPMSACVFWRAGRHIHYFDEIELPNADTEYMCNYLRDQYGDRLQDIYPDATGSARKTAAPAGKTDFWYIRHAGFTVHAPHENPKRKDRYNAVNAKMKPANGQVSLTVSKKCKKLQQYLQTYSHELMNKQEQMSHLLDAFSYPIAYLFPADGVALRKVAIQGY